VTRHGHRTLLVLAAGVLLLLGSARAQPTLTESQAKAAFVLNFARYVEWPERAFPARETPLSICLLGRDPVGNALLALEGRQVQNRVVTVRRLANADEARTCHVLFLAESEERRLVHALRGLIGLPVLTVGDTDGFIDNGGAIGLVQGEGRLQFEVNRHVLDQAQLKASSNLLKLARNLSDLKGRN